MVSVLRLHHYLGIGLLTLLLLSILLFGPGIQSLGARTNEGTAVCVIDRGMRLPSGWWYDSSVDCERYN